MGRRGYPPEFRRKVLDLVDAGRPVVEVARDLGISAQSIYVWRKQDRIDKGLEHARSAAGVPFAQVDDVFAYTDIPVGLWDRIRDRGIIL